MSVEQESGQSESDFQNEYDSDFIMQEKSYNKSDNEDSNFEPKPSKVSFIVFWSSFLMLLRRCFHPTWFLRANIKNFSHKGCQIIVSLQCSDNHTSFWKLQPDCNCFSIGNLMSAVAALFSANTYQRLYVLIMSRTHFRVNLHSIFAWMSRNSLLETGAISEV